MVVETRRSVITYQKLREDPAFALKLELCMNMQADWMQILGMTPLSRRVLWTLDGEREELTLWWRYPAPTI